MRRLLVGTDMNEVNKKLETTYILTVRVNQ